MIDKIRILQSVSFESIVRTFSTSTFCTNSSRNFYDIIITGGGLVGTTLACTLGN